MFKLGNRPFRQNLVAVTKSHLLPWFGDTVNGRRACKANSLPPHQGVPAAAGAEAAEDDDDVQVGVVCLSSAVSHKMEHEGTSCGWKRYIF